MRRPCALTGSMLLLHAVLAGPAKAQAQPQAPADYALPPATTILHLSATGSIQVSPAELVGRPRRRPPQTHCGASTR